MLRRYLPRSAKKPIFCKNSSMAYTEFVCSSLHSLCETVISFKPLLFIKRLNKIQVLTCSLKLAQLQSRPSQHISGDGPLPLPPKGERLRPVGYSSPALPGLESLLG